MLKARGLVLLSVGGLLLAGCGKIPAVPQTGNVKEAVVVEQAGQCQPGPVEIEGYGDKGKRLGNCFVEYPGEPSRQDKSYYIVEDICGQFTKEYISAALGKPIIKTKQPEISSLYNCEYHYSDSNEYVLVAMDYLSVENQKKGHELMGRRVEESDQIPMKNMVVWQEDGKVNAIYLILSDSKFVRVDRSAEAKLSAQELIDLAVNISQGIKDYK